MSHANTNSLVKDDLEGETELGPNTAVEEVFCKHRQELTEFLGPRVKDNSMIEDILHDAFLSLIGKKTPTTGRQLKNYIFRTLRNDLLDNARRARARTTKLTVYVRERSHVRAYEIPDNIAERRERYEKLIRLAEKHLPPRERRAVILKYVHGYEVHDSARLMSVNRRTFSAYLSAGIARIRRCLAQTGGPQVLDSRQKPRFAAHPDERLG